MTRLGDYISEFSVKNHLDESIPVYSVTNDRGFCSGYFNKDVASKDKTTYKIVPHGYFAYNPSRINVGSIAWQNSAERVIVSPLYVVFKVSDKLDRQYLLHYLKSDVGMTFIKAHAAGSVRDSLKFSDLKELPIHVVPLEKQRKIARTLDKLDALISQCHQQANSFDTLVKSQFVEMFGDALLNTKVWTESSLESLADIASGITKGRKVKAQSLTEVPYMAVSNVKDGHIDWTTVKTILATQQEIDQYRLQPEDVLITEGGDPDKVGRGAIIKNPSINCIHQNHIFRVRLDESIILPTYFAEYLQHRKAKQYFLGCAKQTTGIASINMRQLKGLPVLLPPMELQTRFAAFVAQVDKSKVEIQKAIDQLEILKKSLMQQYFG